MQIPIIASLETWSVDYSRNQLNFQMSPHLNIFKFNLILSNFKVLLYFIRLYFNQKIY